MSDLETPTVTVPEHIVGLCMYGQKHQAETGSLMATLPVGLAVLTLVKLVRCFGRVW